jgi:hypothetical protein
LLQTAFDKLASISHFLEAFADKRVSGIEVIHANNIKETTKFEICNCSQIHVAAVTDASTHT